MGMNVLLFAALLVVGAPEADEAPVPEAGVRSETAEERAERQEEEKKLEEDIEDAKEALGHEPEPHEGHEQGEQAHDHEHVKVQPAVEGGPRKKSRRSRHRLRLYPEWYELPTYDGHTKHYYRIWGIADWSLAAGSFAATLGAAGLSAYFASVGFQDGPLSASERNPEGDINPNDAFFQDRVLTKRFYKRAALLSGLVSMAFGATTALLGWRGQTNLALARRLQNQEKLELAIFRRQSFDEE